MSTFDETKIGRIVDASNFVHPLPLRSIDLDDWQRNSGSIHRGLVALKDGEEPPPVMMWLPPPHGFRYETDAEFSKRFGRA